MAVISPSVPIMSLFVIYRSSSLLLLRRRTCCNASVPVTGGSVSAELLHRQPDLVTGIAAHLAVICASVHRSPVPLESLQYRHKIWNPSGKPLSRSQRQMPHVWASRPNSFSRCAEPPPRPRTAAGAPPAVEVEVLRHSFSALAASDVPAC